MKQFICALILLSGTFASAAVFKTDTLLPQGLQSKIISAVPSQCSAFDLKEVSTTEREEYIDQGVIDYFFVTTLIGKNKVDQLIYENVEIVVESAQYSFSNPLAGDNQVITAIRCW